MAEHNNLGKWGEQQAADYLQRKGYRICHRNWRFGHRDLDVTALTPDGETLVIAEVKTRSSADFATPEESVDWRKMRNLSIAANAYVRRYQISCDIRFDVVTVVGDQRFFRIDHIPNAFMPPMM